MTVYANGFEFDLEIRHRLDEEEFQHPFFMHPHRPRRRLEQGLDPGLLRFGIQLSDGRKATNLGSRMPFPLPGDPDEPPEEPVLSPSRGGGGGGGRWYQGFWFWPLPPEGPLAFVCEWPVAGISETRTEIDSALIRDAATDAVVLWPEDDDAGSGGGWISVTSESMGAVSRPVEPPKQADEPPSAIADVTTAVSSAHETEARATPTTGANVTPEVVADMVSSNAEDFGELLLDHRSLLGFDHVEIEQMPSDVSTEVKRNRVVRPTPK